MPDNEFSHEDDASREEDAASDSLDKKRDARIVEKAKRAVEASMAQDEQFDSQEEALMLSITRLQVRFLTMHSDLHPCDLEFASL